jgi:hypothetical protein
MMDFPGPESLIQAGLDAWSNEVTEDKTRRIVNEGRLAKNLGVDFFVTPPPFDINKPYTRLPWLRFPRWHFCPRPGCGLMKQANLDDNKAPTCEAHGNTRRPTMLQMRFVAACANGHLRDFPWEEWLTGGNTAMSFGQIRAAREGGAKLRLRSTGEAGGAGVRVELVRFNADNAKGTVLASRTLAGAFGGDPANPSSDATPLSRIGVKCRGENPAIARSPGDEDCTDCDAPLLVVLRGAGNLYFADVASAIHIPEGIPGKLSEELFEVFDDDVLVRRLLREASKSDDGRLEPGEAREAFDELMPWIQPSDEDLQLFVERFNEIEPYRQLVKMFSELKGLNDSVGLDQDGLLAILAKINLGGRPLGIWRTLPDGLMSRVKDLLGGKTDQEGHGDEPYDLRTREFKVFSRKKEEVEGMPKSILKIRSNSITDYDEIVSRYFEHVSLLDTLRETRVLKGFSRLYARNGSPDEHRRLLWRSAPHAEGNRWLPATMVYGEGIFLRFRGERLTEWENQYVDIHRERLNVVSENMANLAHRRGVEPESSHPRRVMIHTFAHLLINQLIFDSGYGSSSLRERLYFREPTASDPGMAGVLIYTAAGDSEGSMGGLVRMGDPKRLEGAIRRALENAMWCSSDPVCIESHGQGPDSCNLAACHSCCLLPETSCEEQNRLLDRGTVVGTLTNPDCGYFSSLCRV